VDWPAYGRTYGEQHYSPFAEINDRNVKDLGLAWFYHLDEGNPVTISVEVGGIVPGDSAKGFENKAMEMAAKTWKGEWWKYGAYILRDIAGGSLFDSQHATPPRLPRATAMFSDV
jgi:glucose dehydrogenase